MNKQQHLTPQEELRLKWQLEADLEVGSPNKLIEKLERRNARSTRLANISITLSVIAILICLI